MMSKHTPGPWTREKGERFRHDRSAGVKAADGLFIACALDRNRYDLDDEVEANARLIAAAPELKDAAAKTVAALDMWFSVEDVASIDELLEECRRDLKGALSKARGEAP